jgi:hypothetical protein
MFFSSSETLQILACDIALKEPRLSMQIALNSIRFIESVKRLQTSLTLLTSSLALAMHTVKLST